MLDRCRMELSLLSFKARLADAGIWKGARDSDFETIWYNRYFGDMRKAGGCNVTDTGVPECNLILTGCKVGFCNGKIDTEAKERACCAEGGFELGFDIKSSIVLNDAIGIIECNCITGHHQPPKR